MQLRESGNTIQILVYRGYSKEKRRAIVKMIGSINKYTLKPSEGLIEQLTDKERDELNGFIEQKQKTITDQRRADSFGLAITYLIQAGEAIQRHKEEFNAEILSNQNNESIEFLKTATKALTKALAVTGPVKASKKRGGSPDPRQMAFDLGGSGDSSDPSDLPGPSTDPGGSAD